MNKQQKIRIGIIAAGLALVVAIIAVVMVTVGGSTSAYNSHMELAQQYLDDLQYEQAIAEYKAAIEIEPKNEEAYLALADIYVQQGDYEAAIDILNQGLEQTEAEELKVQIEIVSKQYEEVKALQAEQARKEEELSGSTGSQEIICYYETGAIRSIDEFDENGNLVKSTEYYETGAINRITEFDENRNLVKITEYYETGAINCIMEFDENGNMVKSTGYYETGAINMIIEYDENENMVKATAYYETGAINYIQEYDENGNCVKSAHYDADGNKTEIW